MSRTLKLVIAIALLEMSLVALGVAAWRWQALGGTLAAPPPHVSGKAAFGSLMLLFFPAWFAAAMWLSARKMARPGIVVAADTRRYNEITLMAAAAFAVGVQAWAVGSILGLVPKNGMGIRLIEALTGVFMMVAGNFTAKMGPPTGERAPDPGLWTRAMLRIGWISVTAGFVVLVASIAMPLQHMVWVILAAAAVSAVATALQRRNLHRKPA